MRADIALFIMYSLKRLACVTVWRIYTENDYQGMEPHSQAGASVDDLFTVQWRLRKMGVSTISDLTTHLLDTPAFASV